ncbi:LANO_0B02146g1_1 [Lachancea nothofagi CBS 11611]|uniref:LANO_0B02146g1_1 n=1 Tax=Lachancea nothofagi CBS 11611 TaxID=1266666 RepID=A0A1G4IW26_9SACH|nr:LANO_0B02146g1_1 [Lachancea nothofagi CBS 11611]
MKLLRDLKVSRKDLQDWTDNLVWAPDGTLYITTVPDITVCQPVYNKSMMSNSKDLFHTKDYPLSLENKFEFDLAQENAMLNTVPESFVKQCQISPVSNQLAVLTNNGNVCIYQDAKLIYQLDEPQRAIWERTYHSVAWSPCGTLIAVGNECGEVIIFSINHNSRDAEYQHHSSIELKRNSTSWVLKLRWFGNKLIASLSDNSVYLVESDSTFFQIKEPSRFSISDICGIGSSVLVTSVGSIYRYDLSGGKATTVDWKGCDILHIVDIPDQNVAIVISNKTSCLVNLDQNMHLSEDTILAPHLENKFKRWNSYFNELNNYETSLLIHGISTSQDGASLAILYSIDRLSIRYRIVSEQVYRICFLPLCGTWEIKRESTGLAWYQNYQIYNKQLPPLFDAQVPNISLDTGSDFKTYLRMLMSNDEMNRLRFSNFVSDKKDNHLYKKAVYDYAIAHTDEIVNELDKACFQSIASFLKQSPVALGRYVMKGNFIEESFITSEKEEVNFVRSEEGHMWKRCAATFLPLLTPDVKVCPVSGYRIIDIKKDHFNDFGWLTRTLLEFFNNQSIYSGTTMI